MTELSFFKSVMERKKIFVSTFLPGRYLGQLNFYECDRKKIHENSFGLVFFDFCRMSFWKVSAKVFIHTSSVTAPATLPSDTIEPIHSSINGKFCFLTLNATKT